MDYAWHYEKLIDRARTRSLSGYVERHHVVPRCLGGGDESENIVRLTAEEHFIAHLLLVKMHPGDVRLLYAASMMSNTSRGRVRNRRMYGWLRRRLSEAVSKALKGHPVSDATRALWSKQRRGKKRAPFSAETRTKMSAARKGMVFSPEHREALTAAKRGKKLGPRSEEARANLRAGFMKVSAVARARTHCKAGHAWTDENTYHYERNGRSKRMCRTCIAMRTRS